MVAFNEALARAVVVERRFGRAGAPWEFNLRDVLRWSELAEAAVAPGAQQPHDEDDAVGAAVRALFPVVYLHRMRCAEDRAAAAALFSLHFPGGQPAWPAAQPAVRLCDAWAHVGLARLERSTTGGPPPHSVANLLLLAGQMPALEAAAAALAQGWMVALVAPSAAGKTAVARTLAGLAGATLHEVRPPVRPGSCALGSTRAGDEEYTFTLCFVRRGGHEPHR
jgi:midasin